MPKPFRKSFNVQIELIGKTQKATALFHTINAKFHTPGLIYHYLDLRKNKPPYAKEVISLMNNIPKNPKYANEFWRVQKYMAREHLENKNYTNAYRIIQTKFVTDINNYSDAEFFAGWLSVSFLNNPQQALKHFKNFNRVVKSTISKSRSHYWQGRAYAASNNPEKAVAHYKLAAAKYGFTFYGQMAALEIKQKNINLPPAINIKRKDSLHSTDLAKAIKYVLKYGTKYMKEQYLTSASKILSKQEDLYQIIEGLESEGSIHHKAWFGKWALNNHVFIPKYSHPIPYKISQLKVEPSLVFGIIRQESIFDQHAVSSANAMGLMQIIKSSACAVAAEIKEVCSVKQLTANPNYNILLGSEHINKMIKYYDGSYVLAISAYNAGAHKVNKWLKTFGDPRTFKNIHQIIDWIELIPYSETRNYTQRVLENVQVYRQLLNSTDKSRNLHDDLTTHQRV